MTGALNERCNRIERILGQLKINRAIATRYDQLADSLQGLAHLTITRF